VWKKVLEGEQTKDGQNFNGSGEKMGGPVSGRSNGIGYVGGRIRAEWGKKEMG